MGFFDWIFGDKQTKDNVVAPPVRFGRYSDAFKAPENYEAWEQSLIAYEQEKYLEAYQYFFVYLRDKKEENVRVWEEGTGLAFELIQGSQRITGTLDKEKVKIIAKIAKSYDLHVGFMRRLIAQNYLLEYSRYALDKEDNVVLLFDGNTLDSSPYKLYYAFKEVATQADKQDDLLLDEFQMLKPIDLSLRQSLSDGIGELKYHYITTEIKSVFEFLEKYKVEVEKDPGIATYMLLDLVYRLDYLTVPEGLIMELFEQAHTKNFLKDTRTLQQRNDELRKTLQRVADRPKELVTQEFYGVKCTFGVSAAVNHDKVVPLIDSNISRIDWYLDKGMEQAAIAVADFIAGSLLFEFSLYRADKEFLNLLFNITQYDYFKKLGFTQVFLTAQGDLDKKTIVKTIKNIAESHKKDFPLLVPAVNTLDFSDVPNFAKSYLMLVRNLDFTKKEV